MANAALLLVFLAVVGAVMVIWSLNLQYRRRELQHRERMAALEKGVDLPPIQMEGAAPWSSRQYLLRGMIWLFSGLALAGAVTAIAETGRRPPTPVERVMRATDMRARGATPEEIRMVLEDPSARGGVDIPLGLGLLGLVPAGVGLAYLLFYFVERDRARPH